MLNYFQVFGTFAHGLFLATESILFLQEPQIAAGYVCRHCLLSEANNGALFVNDNAFNFPQSPNRSLSTNTYGLSATGKKFLAYFARYYFSFWSTFDTHFLFIISSTLR